MPPVIPGVVQGNQGRQPQRSFLEAMALSSLSPIVSLLLGRGLEQLMPQQESPAAQQLGGQQEFAKDQLLQRGDTQFARELTGAGLGNANIDSQQITRKIDEMLPQAPFELESVMQQEAVVREAAIKTRTRQRFLDNLPAELQVVGQMVIDGPEAGVDAGVTRAMMDRVLGPDQVQKVQMELDQARMAELDVTLAQLRKDDNLRMLVADAMGLPLDTRATLDMVNRFFHDQLTTPAQVQERLLVGQLIQSTADPMTGQVSPSFTVEEAITRTAKVMDVLAPGMGEELRSNMTQEIIQESQARAVLNQLVAQMKRDPRELLSRREFDENVARPIAFDLITSDFPALGITEAAFEEMWREAVDRNLLTGVR